MDEKKLCQGRKPSVFLSFVPLVLPVSFLSYSKLDNLALGAVIGNNLLPVTLGVVGSSSSPGSDSSDACAMLFLAATIVGKRLFYIESYLIVNLGVSLQYSSYIADCRRFENRVFYDSSNSGSPIFSSSYVSHAGKVWTISYWVEYPLSILSDFNL